MDNKFIEKYYILLHNQVTHEHIEYGNYATEDEAYEDMDNCRKHFLEDNQLDNPENWELFVHRNLYMKDKFTGKYEIVAMF